MACMSPEQMRQKEEAKRESEEKSINVSADGLKKSEKMYDNYPNQIDNE